MEKKISLSLPSNVQEAINDLQQCDSELAKGYVELIDQIMMYFINENIQGLLDMDDHELLQFIAEIMAMKKTMKNLIV